MTSVESLQHAFRRANQALEAPTDAALSAIAADRPCHARFLNTLSMLEHLGSHKIMATQHGATIEQATLKHLAEEARHAFFFKRLAEREAGKPLSSASSDLLAPLAARRYFLRLEAEIVRTLPANADRRCAYLMMSIIVEFRAVWGYGIYQVVLVRQGSSISLKSLLAEESSHLDDMAGRLAQLGQFDGAHITHLSRIEQALYERLLSALSGEVQPLAA